MEAAARNHVPVLLRALLTGGKVQCAFNRPTNGKLNRSKPDFQSAWIRSHESTGPWDLICLLKSGTENEHFNCFNSGIRRKQKRQNTRGKGIHQSSELRLEDPFDGLISLELAEKAPLAAALECWVDDLPT